MLTQAFSQTKIIAAWKVRGSAVQIFGLSRHPIRRTIGPVKEGPLNE
jgi:hypothetical protein